MELSKEVANAPSRSWRRGALYVLFVGLITFGGAMLAKGYLMPEPLAPTGGMHEHMHGTGAPSPFFENFLKVYTPRRACMFYEPGLIWLHFVSDLLISLAYFSIPVALIHFVRRRRDLSFTWIFWMFAAFILLCGTTHLFGMWALWQPVYKLDGIVKLLTGIVSIATAITLWPLIPRALALPSPALLEQRVKERTAELSRVTEERQQALQRERELRAEAERSSRLKDEFLANLSHELRTPLNAILGWSQLLKRKPATPDQTQALSIIEQNTKAQVRLIEDLLDLSRIVKGKLRLKVQQVDVPAIIDAALDAVRPAAQAKDITLQKVIDPGVTSITGDSGRLQQVFWNLLTNAIKFTPRGGRVQVFLQQRDSHIEVSVADTGVGVPAHFVPLMFNRFSQADSSITRPFGGLGIGLAITRHLVELHGGSVRASSEGEGKGTVVTVTLPVRLETRAEERDAHFAAGSVSGKALAETSLDGMKVLAIDDEKDTLHLFKAVLEQAGAEVLSATDAATGFELFRRERPDLVLCDLGMPEEDGFSFLVRVRKLPEAEGGQTPVLAVTAFAHAEDRAKVLRAGFDRHVVKPVEPDTLVAEVASFRGNG